MQKLTYHSISFLSLLICLIAVFLVNSCKSPSSPYTAPCPEPGSPYTYGLYDDFESDSINSRLWGDPGFSWGEITIKDDGTGNRICEIRNTYIIMLWPHFIYPDEFNRLIAKVTLPSQNAIDFYACLRYSVKMNEQGGLVWWTKIGICKDSTVNKYCFAELRNHNTREFFHKNLGDAELDKWYRLEMKITKLNSTELKVGYNVKDNCIAESIPIDSAILLDHNKISNPHRYLQAYPYESSQPSASGKGWFDDMWEVYGDVPPGHLTRTHSATEPPSLFKVLSDPLGVNQTLREIQRQ